MLEILLPVFNLKTESVDEYTRFSGTLEQQKCLKTPLHWQFFLRF